MNRRVVRTPALNAQRAILETLAYFDVFDYPVHLLELRRYLHGLQLTPAALQAALHSERLAPRIELSDDRVVLAGRTEIIASHADRSARSRRGLPRAIGYGRVLARLPFVRMVALTGSIAMQNADSTADFDYLLVTAPGRLWLARGFALIVGRWASQHGFTLCPNVMVSERALLWQPQDLYSAHELTQMIPVAGVQIYDRLRGVNNWTQSFLPSAIGAPPCGSQTISEADALKRLAESALQGAFGLRLERIEMRRKIARFTRQRGYGTETVFSADVCQGNFQHHGRRTRLAFQRKLVELGLEPAADMPAVVVGTPPLHLPAARSTQPAFYSGEVSAGRHD